MDRFERFNGDRLSSDPEELVTRAFSRCPNWPKERDGVLGLAQALKQVSDQTGILMEDITRECSQMSQFCPTDFDLGSVARAIKECRQAERDAADPRPPWDRRPSCPKCGGNGWIIEHWLYTYEPNRVTKEPISDTESARLWKVIDQHKQRIYDTARKCDCGGTTVNYHPPETVERRQGNLERAGDWARKAAGEWE